MEKRLVLEEKPRTSPTTPTAPMCGVFHHRQEPLPAAAGRQAVADIRKPVQVERAGHRRQEGDEEQVGHRPGEEAGQDEIGPHQQSSQGQPHQREKCHGAPQVPLLAADGEGEGDDGEKLEGDEI